MTATTRRIRDATLDDSAAIAEIYVESVRAGDSTFDAGSFDEGDARRQLQKLGDRETILVLEQGPEILGWAVIKRYSDRFGYRTTCEKSVYLRRHLVRQGLGSLLQRALLDRCREYGYHHVVSKILAVNAGSVAFNERFGFEVVGVQREVGHLGGRWHDVVIMQLVLDDVVPPDTPRA